MDIDTALDGIETIIFQDPGKRGIESLWTPGCLKLAAQKILATNKSRQSFILTGFSSIKTHSETDGPLGSSILCSTLVALGFQCSLLTDESSSLVVVAAASSNNVLITSKIENICPFSFIISCERPGRSRKTHDYRSMSANDISQRTAPLDLLFPGPGETKNYLTIGIGDGGNECGTGNIADKVSKVVKNGEDICTDRCSNVLIMAGVSNWGAIALAAALVIVSNDSNGATVFLKECEDQRNILQKMLDYGSYDGITGKSELSIDGMHFENEHMAVTNAIVEILKTFLNIP